MLYKKKAKLDLRCLSDVMCCSNLCPASPNKLLRKQHSGFVSSLSVKRWSCQPIEAFKTLCSKKNAISNHMIKGYSSALKKTTITRISKEGTKLTLQPVELYPFQSWRIKTWNNILYNLVGIIKLSVTFQDQNTIDDTLLIITKLPRCLTLSFVPVA